MKKSILLITLISFSVFAGEDKNKPTKTGYGSDMGRNAGITSVKELTEPKTLKGFQKISGDFGQNFGLETTKLVVDGLKSDAFKQVVDKSLATGQTMSSDLGKNIGSEAAKTIAGAALTSTKIAAGTVAGIAAGAATIHIADKAVDRFFPLPQEQANREEANTRTLQAKIHNAREAALLEETQDEIAFTHCLRIYPKQIRNTHGCPGFCQNIFRSLVLAGKKQFATEKLEALRSLDEEPVPQMSAEEAERQLRASFAASKEKDVPMIQEKFSHGFLNLYESEYKIPKESLEKMKEVSPLSPNRFSRVFADGIEDLNPHVRAYPCLMPCCGFPSAHIEKR